MIRLAACLSGGALIAGAAFALLADGLLEGAVAGAVIGASLGWLFAIRKGAAYEYEAAGLHDSNLTTIARRTLIREIHRDAFDPEKTTPHSP